MSDHFICMNCNREVIATGFIGTHNRNHCPFCLWSEHVDENISGDREAKCKGSMMPIALTFKKEGKDKYGKKKQGEIMLVHSCKECGDISINRIAGDDDPNQILIVFKDSLLLDDQLKARLSKNNIDIITDKGETEIKKQLFGDKK